MLKKLEKYIQAHQLWPEQAKILLAISGGVDSMVLLHLLEELAELKSLEIGVAHVNHGLRPESEEEAAYLQAYCLKQGLPYYSRKWQEKNKKRNVEARARTFRYNFFSEVMEKEDYQVLLTAHHGDDQVETILMKLVRGTKLTNLIGIREKQPFANGLLVRPLLSFSKNEIQQFAQQEQLVYFEDETNDTELYTRNRMRKNVIPLLKQENPKFLDHIGAFSKQMELTEELINLTIKPYYESWVSPTEDGWQIDLREWRQSPESIQFFFLTYLLQQTIIKKKVDIQQVQFQQILRAIQAKKPQLTIELENEWLFETSYQRAFLRKKAPKKELLSTFRLNPQEALFLSENEWLAFEEVNSPVPIPEEVTNWREEELLLSDRVHFPLTVRHRKDGDRIALGADWSKKVNRFFIDKKVPNFQREKAWIILSNHQIIWIPKFVNSYLSIPKETDKIHYRLLYKIKE